VDDDCQAVIREKEALIAALTPQEPPAQEQRRREHVRKLLDGFSDTGKKILQFILDNGRTSYQAIEFSDLSSYNELIPTLNEGTRRGLLESDSKNLQYWVKQELISALRFVLESENGPRTSSGSGRA